MLVHFILSQSLVNGVLVPQGGSGVVQGRIDTQGGRCSGLLVHMADGSARVVYERDLVKVGA